MAAVPGAQQRRAVQVQDGVRTVVRARCRNQCPGAQAPCRPHLLGDRSGLASDKTKKVPYLGDWDMLRSQTFLGEMKKDSLLFGSPRMKIAREAMRKHVDVMPLCKAMAETMVSW